MPNKNVAKNHPLYRRWTFIKTITETPSDINYQKYAGGHGITNHFPDWASFRDWVVDNLGLPPTPTSKLHRINQQDDFRPGNLMWAEPKQVGRNQRNIIKITYKRKTKTLRDWCAELNLPYGTIYDRYVAGWPAAEMLEFKTRSYVGGQPPKIHK
jgi:hypothetical protein